MNPSIVSITLLSPGSGRHRASALGVLLALAAGSGQAQTIPAATIDEPLLGGCRASLAQSPEQARVLAERILAREALPAALEIGAIGCMAQAQRRLGEAGNADATTQRLLHALDNPLLARNARQAGLREAAELLQWNGQYSASVHLLEQMREEATGAHDVNGEIDALLSLALLRGQQLGDPEGALLYLQRALALTDPDRRPPTVSELLLHYHHGHTLLALQRRQEARKALRQAAAIALRLPDQQHIAQRIESDNAEIARAEGSTGQAQARLLAVARWQQEHDPQGHVSTLQRLALIRLDLGQADAALALATQAQLLAEQAYYRDELRRGLELMADIHAARGDHASARDYARRGRDMDRDSIRGEGLNALAALQSTIEQPALAGPGSDDPQLRRVRHMRDAAIAACAVLLLVAVSLLVGNQRRRRQLRRLKRIDPLTGLLNRRELERVVAARPHTAADPRSAIVLLDIDSFRQINERCGHPAGDRVLAAVAQRLREACDPDDLIARWDGEEFLIVRHDTTRAAAFALADQLRACVERLQVDTGDAPLLPLSAAVGVAPLALSARQPARLQDGLRLAEHALAIAKRSGSNAWAGIWRSDSGEQVDMLEVIRDPGQALVQRWIVVDANRPAAWETLRATHLKTSTFGGTEVPLGS